MVLMEKNVAEGLFTQNSLSILSAAARNILITCSKVAAME
jgi:hypothetical protein